jgi:O-antigen/teichoic acid export membrane protein
MMMMMHLCKHNHACMVNNLKIAALSGLKWSTIGTVGQSLFQILQIAILTRFLSKEDFGLVAMALFVVNFTNIFVDMGFTSAILHRQNTNNSEYSSVYWCNLLISILLFSIVFALSPFLSQFYREPELFTLIPILSTNLILLAIGRLHQTIMRKEFRFKQISLINLSACAFGLIFAFFLAKSNFGVYSLVYSTLTVSAIVNIAFLFVNIHLHPIYFHFRYKEIKPFLKIGSYSVGSQFISFFSTDIDILIIGKMLGPGPLGIYSLSKQIILKVYSIITSTVTNVLTPLMSVTQTDESKLKAYYLEVTSILSSLNIPIYLIIIILSKEILIVLYGYKYLEANLILSFLAISYCINAISNPVGSLQIATGRTDIGLRWAIFSLLITPPVIYFSSLANINIVALFKALLSLVMLVPLWWIQLKTMANIKLGEFFVRFIKPYLILLFLAPVYLMCSRFYELPFGVIANSVIKGSLGILSYGGLLWLIDKKRINKIINISSLLYKIKFKNPIKSL